MAEFKGFVSSNEEALSADVLNKFFDYGVMAYNAGRYVEAFCCFSKQKDDCLESRFNMALILWKSGLIEKALDELAKANKILAAGATSSMKVSKEIEEVDAASDGYKRVMLRDEIKMFPGFCRVRYLRLQVDLLYELHRYDDVKKIIPGLTGKGYKNIERIADAIA